MCSQVQTNCVVDHVTTVKRTVADMLGTAEAWNVWQLTILAELGKGFLIVPVSQVH